VHKKITADFFILLANIFVPFVPVPVAFKEIKAKSRHWFQMLFFISILFSYLSFADFLSCFFSTFLRKQLL